MITIFTTPKPFRGHSAIIQRNAIRSWTLLEPKPQVIIFGDEEGIAEISADLKLIHVADVERTEHGTPLISAMFREAQKRSVNPLMCFINADIMLTSSFVSALRHASAAKPEFVMTGRRTLVDIDKPWDFDGPHWERAIIEFAASSGVLDNWVAMDYFAFPRGLYRDIPPFAVGRARWDNWMIYSAIRKGIPVIDATEDILAIHQNHDYSHLAGGLKDCFVSPDGERNQQLYGLQTCIGTADATYLLRGGRLRRPFGRATFSRRLETLPVFKPALARAAWPLLAVRDFLRSRRSDAETPAATRQS
jgi:hypothetical protein